MVRENLLVQYRTCIWKCSSFLYHRVHCHVRLLLSIEITSGSKTILMSSSTVIEDRPPSLPLFAVCWMCIMKSAVGIGEGEGEIGRKGERERGRESAWGDNNRIAWTIFPLKGQFIEFRYGWGSWQILTLQHISIFDLLHVIQGPAQDNVEGKKAFRGNFPNPFSPEAIASIAG